MAGQDDVGFWFFLICIPPDYDPSDTSDEEGGAARHVADLKDDCEPSDAKKAKVDE